MKKPNQTQLCPKQANEGKKKVPNNMDAVRLTALEFGVSLWS